MISRFPRSGVQVWFPEPDVFGDSIAGLRRPTMKQSPLVHWRFIDVVIVGALMALMALLVSRPTATSVGQDHPRILVIGDSIAVGGWAHAVEGADIIPENGRSSSYTAQNLLRWLEGAPHYDVILWNNGLHDAMRGEDGQCAVDLDAYALNLRGIGQVLQMRADRVFFIASVPPQHDGAFDIRVEDVVARNRRARRLMAELGIPVIPLDAFSAEAGLETYDGLHFTTEGARAQAAFIWSQVTSRGAAPR